MGSSKRPFVFFYFKMVGMTKHYFCLCFCNFWLLVYNTLTNWDKYRRISIRNEKNETIRDLREYPLEKRLTMGLAHIQKSSLHSLPFNFNYRVFNLKVTNIFNFNYIPFIFYFYGFLNELYNITINFY